MMSVCKEDEERKLKGGGYTISVVVLEKMEISDELRRKYRKGTSLPAIFADALKNRLNRGRCNDDALIVLAINDSSLQTSTGGVISTKLTNEFVFNVSRNAQNFLIRGEFTKGLLYIIDEFAFRLGAKSTDWVDLYFWIFFPEFWRQSSIRWPLLILAVILIIALILISIFTFSRLRKPPQYTQGREILNEKEEVKNI
uniref:TPM domain-containing protein n=1 Tax=Meloidogyne incognita TaxID=6306 RepID=A0A914M1H9_MELIC